MGVSRSLDKADPPRVVVVIDGSEDSLEALRLARDEADLRDGLLQVVYAFESPTVAGISLPEEAYESIEAEARDVVDGAMKAAEVSELLPPERVVRTVVASEPVPALVDASNEAALLVVGSRGRGALQSMVLGSVSNHCVHLARCPVVVVRSGSVAATTSSP